MLLEWKSSFGECLKLSPSQLIIHCWWLCCRMQAISSDQTDCNIYKSAFRLKSPQTQQILYFLYKIAIVYHQYLYNLVHLWRKHLSSPAQHILPSRGKCAQKILFSRYQTWWRLISCDSKIVSQISWMLNIA